MSTRRVKNVGLNDDDFDDYDEDDYEYDEQGETGEEKLSPEDQEQMRQGIVEVRQALGPTYTVTDKEIQDSLWHYYYDVGKTVVWLKNQNKPAQPRIQKDPSGSKSSGKQGAKADDISPTYPIALPAVSYPVSFPAADFFKDCPWLRVPSGRLAELVAPISPRGRLLGGSSDGSSGKMSKLAALAAARKKREAENSRPGPGSAESPEPKHSSITLLNQLGKKTKAPDNGPKGPNGKDERQSCTPSDQPTAVKRYSIRRRDDVEPTSQESISRGPEISEIKRPAPQVYHDVHAKPSEFAKTMFGDYFANQQVERAELRDNTKRPRLMTVMHLTESHAFAGPSPDDIVTTAQAGKAGKESKSTGKQATAEKSASQVTNGVSSLSVEESKVKSKNLDVIAEYKKDKHKNAANFVVIGHVDAGKSTLMGRLLLDLKVVDTRTVEKYRKEAEKIGKSSFALAWVLDQGTEERSRGVTIDIATNHFETEKTSFTILDAPGHRDFIPNMIAGASQADFAILVIDASTGSFESGLKGQTKEHALLVRSMGVQKIIIAVNKLDTVSWSQDRFSEIQQQVAAFLSTAGFQPKNVCFIPCSGLTGDNILRRASKETLPWYDGPTLVEELDNSETGSKDIEKPLRLTINDIFRGGIQNPLSISGRLDAGQLQVGDQIFIAPSGEKAVIKGVEVDQESKEWAVAGQNVVLHLVNIDPIHLRTGDVVCSPSSPVKTVTSFTTKILAFDVVTPMLVDIHRGRLHSSGRISQLIATIDKVTGEVIKKKPRVVQPGNVARVRVEMDTAVPLEAPARVVLRANGETVAAGLLEQ